MSSSTVEEFIDVGEILDNTNLQELILTYVNPPLAMVVCQQWTSFAEKHPERMRPYEMDSVEFSEGVVQGCTEIQCETYNECFIRSENVNFVDVFKHIRFVHTTRLEVISPKAEYLNHLNTAIPLYWKKDITSMMLQDLKDDSANVKFVKGFSNLANLSLVNPLGDCLALSYINAMSKIESICIWPKVGRVSQVVATDAALDMIRWKSKKINRVVLECRFSPTAIINFIKKSSFSENVLLRFCQPLEANDGEENLMAFLGSCEDFDSRPFGQGTYFVFGSTKFQLFIKPLR